MSTLLGSNSTHFVHEIYGQRHAIFPAPLAPAANWLARDPLLNSFMAEADLNRTLITLVNLYGRSQDAIAFRDRHAADVPLDTLLERVSLEHLYDYLVQHSYSVVIREEYFPGYAQTSLEELIQTAFGSSTVTSHVYLSGSEAHALNPHTDPYDVLVLHLHGQKHWTVCHPLDSSTEWADASQAQLAQLFEIQRKSVDGCTNFDIAETDKMRCEHFTLSPGDVLYLPKSTIHFATTSPNTTTAHITLSLERQGQSWIDLVRRACAVLDNQACTVIESTLASLETSPSGLHWLELATFPTDEPCQMAQKRLLGFEKDSLRTLVAQDPQLDFTYVTSKDVLATLQRLASCTASLGWDSQGREVTFEGLLTNPVTHYDTYATSCYPCPGCPSGYTRTGCGGSAEGTCVGLVCPALPAVSSAVLTYSNSERRYPVIATFACVAGFEQTGGDASRSCTPALTWAGAEIICTRVSCGDLPALSNGFVDTSGGIDFESVATFSCNEGYTRSGPASRTCQASGEWSGSAPMCVTLPCPSLPVFAHGSATSSSSNPIVGATLTYACDAGYTLSGNTEATCIWSGSAMMWNTEAPTCTAIPCDPLVAPANGELDVSNNGIFPATATYNCQAGYTLTADGTRTCQTDGTWSGSVPACTGVPCETLTAPPYGAVSSTHNWFPSTVTFTCFDGYELAGASSLECRSDGSWSDSAPTCKPCAVNMFRNTSTSGPQCESCPAFSSTGGLTARVTCACNAGFGGVAGSCQACPVNTSKSTVDNAPCTACAPGYMTSGTNAETCDGVPCAMVPSIAYGSFISTNNNRYPSTGTFSCETGFALANDDNGVRTCQIDGSWSAEAASCSPVCGDGIRVFGEECDDGANNGNDGCADNCTITPGYYCHTEGETCSVCSINTPPSDLTVDCADYAVDLAVWRANNLGAVADTHTNCGAPTFTTTALNVSGPDPGCSAHLFRVDVSFAKGGSDFSLANLRTSDTVPPVFTAVPDGGLTYQCHALPSASSGISATDTCAAFVNITSRDETIAGACANNYTLQRTWTAVDGCQNAVSVTRNYTVIDTTAPTFQVPPQNLYLECDGTPQDAAIQAWLDNNGGATIRDACTGPVTVTHNFAEVAHGLVAGCAGVVGNATVTFQAVDDCGNMDQANATIVRRDTTPPVFVEFPDNVTVSCSAAEPTNFTVAVTDICTGNATVVLAQTWTEPSATCGHAYTVFRTWTASDVCGNKLNLTHTVSVVDETAPTLPSGVPTTVLECNADSTRDDVTALLEAHVNISAADACGGNAITWSFDALNLSSTLTGNYSAQLYAHDDCANALPVAAPISIVDTQPPVLSNLSVAMAYECDAVPQTEDVVVRDACDTNVQVVFGDNITQGQCPQSYTLARTIWATDNAGWQDNFTQFLTVVDTTAPQWVAPPADVVFECDGAGNTANVTWWLESFGNGTAQDACSSNVTWQSNGANATWSQGCGQTLATSVQFSVQDECGNARTHTASFAALDTQPPVLYWANTTVAPVSTAAPASITGASTSNTSSSASPTTGPAVTSAPAGDEPVYLVGPPPNMTLECIGRAGLEPTRPDPYMVMARDVCSGSEYDVAYEETRHDGHCMGLVRYVRAWTAVDSCSNAGTMYQTVAIQDTTPPQVQSPPQDLQLECDRESSAGQLQQWLDAAGYGIAEDTCSDVTWSHNLTNPMTTFHACEGMSSMVVRFTVTDDCGNAAHAFATVNVVDTQAPIITAVPPAHTIECDLASQDAQIEAWLLQSGNALAVDGCSDTLSRNYTSSQQTMCANTKVVTANFSFTDTCGWQASALGTLSVQDTVPPTIVLRGSNATTTEAGFAWLDPGVEAAFDTCQGAINVSIVQRQQNVNISTLGEQAIEYAVADDCQNTGSIVRLVTVQDTLSPVVRVQHIVTRRIRRGAKFYPSADVTAEDWLEGSITNFSFVPPVEELSASASGMYVLSYAASDSSGNMAVAPGERVIVVDAETEANVSESSRVTLTFDTRLATLAVPARAVAVSLYVILQANGDEASSARQLLTQAYERRLAVYREPLCWAHQASFVLCRLDMVEAAQRHLEALLTLEGLVAIAPFGVDVLAYEIAVADSTLAVQQDYFMRIGAIDAALIACESTSCRYHVERSQVVQAAAQEAAFPRAVLQLRALSSWKDADNVEQDLLALGLFPLFVHATDAASTFEAMVLGVPEQDALISLLQERNLELSEKADVASNVVFASGVRFTLNTSEAPTVMELLHGCGLAGYSIVNSTHNNATGTLDVVVQVPGVLHSAMLATLQAQAGVLFVSDPWAVRQAPIQEDEFPFAWQWDLDLDRLPTTSTTRSTSATVTSESDSASSSASPLQRRDVDSNSSVPMTAEEYISAILDDLNATSKTEFACEGFSAALWSCTLRTAAHWYPDTVTTLLSTYPGVASIMVANDTSMVGSLQDAVEDWIYETLGQDGAPSLSVHVQAELTGTVVNGQRNAVYTVTAGFVSNPNATYSQLYSTQGAFLEGDSSFTALRASILALNIETIVDVVLSDDSPDAVLFSTRPLMEDAEVMQILLTNTALFDLGNPGPARHLASQRVGTTCNHNNARASQATAYEHIGPHTLFLQLFLCFVIHLHWCDWWYRRSLGVGCSGRHGPALAAQGHQATIRCPKHRSDGGVGEVQESTYGDADAGGDGDYQDLHHEVWGKGNDEDLQADGMYSDMFNEPDKAEDDGLDESGYLNVGGDMETSEDTEQPGFGFDAFGQNDDFDQNGFDDSYFEADDLDRKSGNADEYLEADGFEQEDTAIDDETDE
ncbi:uncharacterized protein MONBRDRAFT_38713 [Monosiga brevicollis MX1]|uniref:Ribosomal oxygenase 2 n=1 Tax=Monosiga brevicollis TaxID=81824 RepID=A9V9N8_MONBE|nr:uncharacterized protein MONBRDRAFT_38713 [Monosiga brevicollis MX1]EDQ85702.1 predicted protein [Monosiga brevicollis MX1]|eukprot:XP_001749417.1 hypothetical protein [Monosiga brevicollis MX1]